jgi:hypothetical protein
MNIIYNHRPNLYIGFHGCDRSVRDKLINTPNTVKKSEESYDWLGHGFYVWENNYKRALQWALYKKKKGEIKHPDVVGVVYQLRHCLDFTDSEYTEMIAEYYKAMSAEFILIGNELPKNKDIPGDFNKDIVIRELDCAVIEYLHQKISENINKNKHLSENNLLHHFDTVRGVFTEGGPAFDGAGIQLKSHIQICIRNLNCIQGFFIPRQESRFP